MQDIQTENYGVFTSQEHVDSNNFVASQNQTSALFYLSHRSGTICKIPLDELGDGVSFAARLPERCFVVGAIYSGFPVWMCHADSPHPSGLTHKEMFFITRGYWPSDLNKWLRDADYREEGSWIVLAV